ncbi:MAG TPA: glycoside hydrolase family 32 protein [Fimbriimonadaceae bacterium]|jgi:sucrose-6-phosphate hydrolase SacC (GH32 family)
MALLPILFALTAMTTSQTSPLYHESLRPQFHFTARQWNDHRLNPVEHQEGWINDLNGLIYYDGEYHMFAQRWATCWLHAVSKDLVHWTELQPAFWEEAPGSGVQSGTCVIDYKNSSGLSPDPSNPPMVAFWSRFDNRSQCICYSLDHGRTWTRYAKNPIMIHPERDPKVFWYGPGKHWVMMMYGEGQYHILTSTNLLDWKDEHHPVPNSFECPDFFELPIDGNKNNKKWVLIQGSGYYSTGSFDGAQFSDESERLPCDTGPNFYATQTWGNTDTGNGKRVQAAWMHGSHFPGMPFNQQISLPCELSLHTTPAGIRLYRKPIEAVNSLHKKELHWKNLALRTGDSIELTAKGDLYHLRAEVEIPEGSQLVFTLRGIDVTLGPQSFACNGPASNLPLPVKTIDIYLDRGSLESYVDDGLQSDTRFVLPKTEGISVRAQGKPVTIKSLSLWPMKSIWPARPIS